MQSLGTFARAQLAIVLAFLIAIPAIAQGVKPSPSGRPTTQKRSADGDLPDRDKLNAGTVTIITAPVGGAFAAMGSDMVRVLDDGDNLRILPVIAEAPCKTSSTSCFSKTSIWVLPFPTRSI